MIDISALSTPIRLQLVVSLAALYPLTRIFRRAGLNPLAALLVMIPVVGFAIAGSLLAFRPWPAIEPRGPRKRGGG